jgi:hypothetical protein
MQEAEECKPLEALDLTRVSSFSGFFITLYFFVLLFTIIDMLRCCCISGWWFLVLN